MVGIQILVEAVQPHTAEQYQQCSCVEGACKVFLFAELLKVRGGGELLVLLVGEVVADGVVLGGPLVGDFDHLGRVSLSAAQASYLARKHWGNLPDGPTAPMADEALDQILSLMGDFAPLIPDAVVDYELARGGVETSDVKVKRLLALATQKFISQVACDAMQHAKTRQQQSAKKTVRSVRWLIQDRKTTLTMEDLSAAMAEHGVTINKPEYYT